MFGTNMRHFRRYDIIDVFKCLPSVHPSLASELGEYIK
jgi:hypothetical protein